MDRMKAIEHVREGLGLLESGSHLVKDATVELRQALDLLDYPGTVLTDRERTVLDTMASWTGARPPTFQQLAEACGLSSRSYARELVISLENKGYVKRATGRARSFTLVRPANDGKGD